MCTLEPSVSDGVLAAAKEVIGCQGDSHARRGLVVAIFSVAAVGALARVERHWDIIEPPGRPTKSLERCGSFLLTQRCHEVDTRVLPGAFSQCLPTGVEGIRSLDSGDVHRVGLRGSQAACDGSRPDYARARERGAPGLSSLMKTSASTNMMRKMMLAIAAP